MSKTRVMQDVNDDLVLVLPEKNIERVKADSAYVCQNERTFRNAAYVAFYNKNAIRAMAKIVSIEDDVDMMDPEATIKDPDNKYLKVKDDDRLRTVIKFTEFQEVNIPNNQKSKTGKVTAFVQGQRYISHSKLQDAATTTELL